MVFSLLLQRLSIRQTRVEFFCVSRAKILKSLETKNFAPFLVRVLWGNKRIRKIKEARISLLNDKRFSMPPKEVALDVCAGCVNQELASRPSACPPVMVYNHAEPLPSILRML